MDTTNVDNIADIQNEEPVDNSLRVENGDTDPGQVILTTDPDTAKKQPIQRINWFFTWNNYPENYNKLLLDAFEFKNGVRLAKKYVWQPEIGKEGTKHIQGCVSLYKKMRWTEFGLPKEIHWERVRNWNDCAAYCSKFETRDGTTTIYPPIITKTPLKIIENLYPWQQKIVDNITQPADNRSVNWIYDPDGNKGKTAICKYLYAKYKAIPITSNNENDIFYILAKLQQTGTDLNNNLILLFNFTKTKHSINYNLLEQLKDGLGTSGKYESTICCFNSPHVWVFSNNVPCRSNMTEDRWRIWEINSDNDLIEKKINDGSSLG